MLDLDVIADQIDRAYRGGSWHGPSVCDVLADVSAEDAEAHPIPGAHSIHEIVLHLIGGYRLVLGRIRGEPVRYSPEGAWPPVSETGEAAWRADRDTLDGLNRELVCAVRAFPVARLAKGLGSEFPAYIQFCGAPQHDLYHAGQIAILKKALAASRAAD
ncbi:MAG: DinB family protein [Planctomycetota bacterium]